MSLRKALVFSFPSVDGCGKLSEWDQRVTFNLLSGAGFVPDATFFAHPTYVSNWTTLFEQSNPRNPLTPAAEAHRQTLLQNLQSFDIALTMGTYALYCLTGETRIDLYRNTHIDSPFVPNLQVVPTYDPEIFARKAWHERPVVFAAAQKACARYVETPSHIFLPDTIADLYHFSTVHIRDQIAFDVETNSRNRITDFSIAASPHHCLYVQLETPNFQSVWSAEDELQVFLWLQFLAARKDLTWIMHNAVYDLTYLDQYGIRPLGHIADTMLRHHGFQPEFEKSLGFLASLYLPTRAWKHLRTRAKKEFAKKEAL